MMTLSCVYLVVNLTMGHDGLVMCAPGSYPDYGMMALPCVHLVVNLSIGHDGLAMCAPGS